MRAPIAWARRLGLAALLCLGAAGAHAQPAAPAQAAPAAQPLPRTGALRTEMVPSLFVLNARGAALHGTTLTLSGVNPTAIVFADRPVRAAGHLLTSHLIEEWGEGSDSFRHTPPNATVSVLAPAGDAMRDIVVVLRDPRLEGDRLTFTVQVLEGELDGAAGPAAVFIDMLGRFWGAGLARRAARRAFWYDTARDARPPPPAAGYPPPAGFPPLPGGYYPPPPAAYGRPWW